MSTPPHPVPLRMKSKSEQEATLLCERCKLSARKVYRLAKRECDGSLSESAVIESFKGILLERVQIEKFSTGLYDRIVDDEDVSPESTSARVVFKLIDEVVKLDRALLHYHWFITRAADAELRSKLLGIRSHEPLVEPYRFLLDI